MAEHTLVQPAVPGDAAGNDPTVDAQLRDVRDSLLRDGLAAGVDPAAINSAIDRAAAFYAHRPVRAFVGVLVERSVRERLTLRRRSL
jgi:hypothetical protein